MNNNRLAYILVAATFVYVGVEYLLQRRASFNLWRAEFMAPFLKHPGRRDFLHDTLIREEFNA